MFEFKRICQLVRVVVVMESCKQQQKITMKKNKRETFNCLEMKVFVFVSKKVSNLKFKIKKTIY